MLRSIALRRPSLGVGGSTLPMQFVRVIYNTPPHSDEGGFTKLRRKVSEWWLAPVVYRELTRGADDTPLKQWAANHLWLAQRTGGSPLHGVELASRVIFGKDAGELSVAEQFVMASAVNKPIILLKGNDRLNEVRLDRWRYITEVRARTCAEKLLTDEAEKQKVVFELIAMAGGPPDPKVKPKLQAALERYAPEVAKRAEANPVVRANALMPSARFGLREEMKQAYGFAWRDHVRGVTATFDAGRQPGLRRQGQNRAEGAGPVAETQDLGRLHARSRACERRAEDAEHRRRGRECQRRDRPLLRGGRDRAYFGSPFARDPATGHYDAGRDPRMIASTGKIISAIAIANSGRDSAASLYVDTQAPEHGLETCAKGNSRFGRRAHRQLRLLAQCAAVEPHGAGRPVAREGLDRRLRLQHAEARRERGSGTPPSTRRRAGPDLGQPAPRASHVRRGAGRHAGSRRDAGARAVARGEVRFHRARLWRQHGSRPRASSRTGSSSAALCRY